MVDTPKKTRTTATKTKTATAAKPRKTAAKKSANGTADPVAINGHMAAQESSVSYDEVAKLAHSFWQERGGNHGYHIEDWFRAEQELRGK